eukprot:PhF_6_TR40801/c0_g1_i2/m.61641
MFHPHPARTNKNATNQGDDNSSSNGKLVKTHPLDISINNTASISSDGGSGSESPSTTATTTTATKTVTTATVRRNPTLLNWPAKKITILQQYTTKDNFPVQSKVLGEDASEAPQEATEEAKQKLERLEETHFQGGPNQQLMSQKELVQHVENLASDLSTSWNNGEKVKSLRLTIQACKLIGHTKVPLCYPSVFVLVSKVLDLFGSFVYERILSHASRSVPLNPKTFLPCDVSEESKDMCLNWFFKIASIRELLPRVYVEIALLKCNAFLYDRTTCYEEVASRLGKQLRGVGDLLVANHARLYLALKMHELSLPPLRPVVESMLSDFFASVQHCDTPRVQAYLAEKLLSKEKYVTLFLPSMAFMMEISGQESMGATIESLSAVMEWYRTKLRYAQVLQMILQSYAGKHIFVMYHQIVEELSTYDSATTPAVGEMWGQLGLVLAEVNPKEKKHNYLREAWPHVMALSNTEALQKAAACWCVYIATSLRPKDVNGLITDVRGRTQGQSLKHLLRTCVTHIPDVVSLLHLESFAQALYELPADEKCEISMLLLDRVADSSRAGITDPIIVNALLDCAKIVHDDGLRWESPIPDVVRISRTIESTISKVMFENDVESQLSFYADCRRSFTKVDSVKETVVAGAIRLVRMSNVKSHAKKAATMAKACLAFCHMTIPSIMNPWSRMRLCLETTSAALTHNFLQQAEVHLKLCMTTLNETTLDCQCDEDDVLTFISSFIGICVAVPGNPDFGPFYLFQAISSWNSKYAWGQNSDGRGRVYLMILHAVVAMMTNSVPYKFEKVSGNDELYADSFNTKVQEEGSSLVTEVLEGALKDIQTLAQLGIHKKSSSLGLDLFNSLAIWGAVDGDAVRGKILVEAWRVGKQCVTSQTLGYMNTTLKWAKG